jgi:large subunit ribosomal protein L13e
LQANVQRLKLYKSKLVVFPRKAGKPKAGDGSAADLAAVQQQQSSLPIKVVNPRDKARAITPAEKTASAYTTLRKATAAANRVGEPIKIARLVEAGEDPANAKKIVRSGKPAPTKK